ncbi:MAG: hypothetical protein K2M11_11005 [Paramuribaculum sp.]|nr:hypothetical protein [Paramuribaculum sp.]
MMGEPLEPIFLELAADTAQAAEMLKGQINIAELRKNFVGIEFNRAYDLCRELARQMVIEGRELEAVDKINEFDELITRKGEEEGMLADLHAALLQIKAGLLIHIGETDEALRVAAACLNILALEPKRRDEPFLSVLAALLYDIARVNNLRGQYRNAEREIEKSAKIYERLAKTAPERYGVAHMLAVAAATKAYTSRVKQAEMLARFHEATGAYMEEVSAGVENAAVKLVDSLEQEGKTLMQMGRQREAVQYFTRALKYLTKIEDEFTIHQLELSVALGEALLAVKSSKDKGIHLLNTMLHKASRLNADEVHRKIVDILLNARNHGVDILGFWHKIFPR